VALEPGQAREVGWDVQAPLSRHAGVGRERGRGGGGPASTDRIKIKQKVVPAVPVTVMQATLLQLDRKQAWQVAPDDAVPGRGGVQCSSAPSWAASCRACATTCCSIRTAASSR
jgi:hypothetical protein